MFFFLSRFLQRNVGQWTEFLQHFRRSKGMVQESSKMSPYEVGGGIFRGCELVELLLKQ
jgi:hypothetical protein